MNQSDTLEWSALEYEERYRTPDWFWALGVIVITIALAAIIFANYFFAALILISGALLRVFATRKPEMVHYELGEKGFKVRDRLYPYDNIKAFWVEESHKPTLFVRSERIFMPIISAPIELEWAEAIKEKMTAKNIPQEEMKEHISEKIMESLGF